MTALYRLPVCLALVLLWATPCANGQPVDPKNAFLQALARFSVSIDGTFGDEGRTARAAFDAMVRGLGEWDATLRVSEAAFAAELPRADPALAARMHVALGAAYLDRARLGDALHEFDAASRLDPTRADVFVFEGLAHAQIANDPARAVESFRQAAALDPASPVRAYLLARALGKSGRHAEARQAYQTVLRLWSDETGSGEHASKALDAPFIRLGLVQERSGVEPFFPPVLYADGFLLLQRGDFAKALDAFGRGIAHDPLVADAVDPREAMGLAAAALRDGATDAAARHLKVAIELEPNRAEVHRQLGRVLLVDRQYDEALRELQLALRLNPNDERTHLTLSDALIEARRYADAERALQDAIQRFPSSGRAYYKLARLYQRENKLLEALREFEAAVKLNPLIGLNRILQTIGALNAAQQNFDAAAEAYSHRADVHPNDPDAHQILGHTYSRLERSDEALAEFAVALMLKPDWPDTYVAMAQLYLKQGEYGAAAGAARQAIRRNAAHKQARYTLATALMRLDKADEAKPELEAFERLQRDETAALARQMALNALRREASARSDSGEYERAVVVLRKALELAPETAVSHLELGVALLKSGQPAEAIEHLQTAVRLQAPVEVHQHLAAAYAAVGRNEESRQELSTYQRLRMEALQRAAADR
jgi:tetratricopeptide (TPR) repeat protein